MIVENYFPSDPRVRKEALSLAPHYNVDVLSLLNKGQSLREVWEGINIFRFPEIKINTNKKYLYIIEYLYFTIAVMTMFLLLCPVRRYKVVHVHNPPDTLFPIGIICRMFGIKFVYDLHDLSPELYLSRFSSVKDLFYKVLLLFEKWTCKTAHMVITTNESYKKLIVSRHQLNSSNVSIVRNDPIIEEWESSEKIPDQESTMKIGLFVGSINPQDGFDVLLHVVHKLVHERNRKDFIIKVLGKGDSLEVMKKLASELKVEEQVYFDGYITDRRILADRMMEAHFGLEPAPESPLNRHSTFIKVMEYMITSTPVIAFDLPETRFSMGDAGVLIPPGDLESFADAVEQILNDKDKRQFLGQKGLDRIRNELNWDAAEKVLLSTYSEMNVNKKTDKVHHG